MKRASIERSCGRILVVVAWAALAGCEGAASDPVLNTTDPLHEFLGTWHYDDTNPSMLPMGTASCPGNRPVDLPPFGNKRFGRGQDGRLVDLSVSPIDPNVFCDFAFDISEFNATVRAKQTCLLTGGDKMKPTQWRFTLLGPGIAEEVGGSTIEVSFTDPASNTPSVGICDFSLTARLIKVTVD